MGRGKMVSSVGTRGSPKTSSLALAEPAEPVFDRCGGGGGEEEEEPKPKPAGKGDAGGGRRRKRKTTEKRRRKGGWLEEPNRKDGVIVKRSGGIGMVRR